MTSLSDKLGALVLSFFKVALALLLAMNSEGRIKYFTENIEA